MARLNWRAPSAAVRSALICNLYLSLSRGDEERLVEKAAERNHACERGEELAIEVRPGRERRILLARAEELAVAEIDRRGMLFVESAWHARQLLAFQPAQLLEPA